MSETVKHGKLYSVGFLLDNGISFINDIEEDNTCPHQAVAIAVVRAAVAELRKHIDVNAAVDGELNRYLRFGFGDLGKGIHDFCGALVDADHTNEIH